MHLLYELHLQQNDVLAEVRCSLGQSATEDEQGDLGQVLPAAVAQQETANSGTRHLWAPHLQQMPGLVRAQVQQHCLPWA